MNMIFMKYQKIYLMLYKIDRFIDCLYSCISYYLYEAQENHLKIRHEVYE